MFYLREGDEMGRDALLRVGTGKPDCSSRVPVNLGPEGEGPKAKNTFPAGNSFSYISGCICMSNFPPTPLSPLPLVELVFAGIVKTGAVEREFKLLPHEGWEFTSAMKVRVKN